MVWKSFRILSGSELLLLVCALIESSLSIKIRFTLFKVWKLPSREEVLWRDCKQLLFSMHSFNNLIWGVELGKRFHALYCLHFSPQVTLTSCRSVVFSSLYWKWVFSIADQRRPRVQVLQSQPSKEMSILSHQPTRTIFRNWCSTSLKDWEKGPNMSWQW